MSTNGTNATAGQGNNSTNSTAKSKIVSADPYTVTSCDQVVEFSGQIISDMNDFSKKSPAFFTISVYMVNQFEKKDGNTLTQSISIDKILTVPNIIQGSVSCINFQDVGGKLIPMCLESKATAKNILKAFNQFMKCRMGDNLKNTPAHTIQNILKASCLGLDVSFDINKFGGDLNKAKAALSTAMNSALKNAAKNLKGSVSAESSSVDPKNVIDSKSGAKPQA